MKSRNSLGSMTCPSLLRVTFFLFLAAGILATVLALDARGQSADKAANLSVSPTSVNFLNAPQGIPVTQGVTVTNSGDAPGFLDVSLGPLSGCGVFSLNGLSGAVTVPANDSVDIIITFESATIDTYQCFLVLGAGLTDVPIQANVWDPTLAWSVTPAQLLFEGVALNLSRTLEVKITNTGGLPFTITPSIPASCPEFVITDGGHEGTVILGYPRKIEVTFTPTTPYGHICQLDLGTTVPPVPLNGVGIEPQYGWDITPVALDFGYASLGTLNTLGVKIRNTGDLPLPVEPSVDPALVNVFVPITPPLTIARGDSANVLVEFRPDSAVTYNTDLELGTVLPPVPMTGIGREPFLDWTAPTSLDFGLRDVGQSARGVLTVTNTGTIPFALDPDLPDTCQSFFIVGGGGAITLGPGFQRVITVEFLPVVPGSHAVSLDLGPIVPPVELTGTAQPLPELIQVSPNPLGFQWRFTGAEYTEMVTVSNTGGTFVDLDVALADTAAGFSILLGAGPRTLPPGHDHQVEIQFHPQLPGSYATTLNLGTQVPAVPVTGEAEAPVNVFTVQPDSLVFGPIGAGTTQGKAVSITNNSNQYLTINPATSTPEFIDLQQAMTVVPGTAVLVNVIFQPTTVGTFFDTLDLQNPLCPDVALVGSTTLPGVPGQNLVGIFFDGDYTSHQTHTFQPNAVVQGFLVMIDPSETSGVSAWELRTNIDGNAAWLGWVLEGQHINVGSYEEFIVGIGGTPLPYGPTVLLGTFQLFVPQPYPEPVILELHPIRQPSLTNSMVWAAGSNSSLLAPLHPFTGESAVAGINVSQPSDVGVPARPAVSRLLPNVPNPFNPSTEIRFELAKAQHARVAIYDVTGRLVKIMTEGTLAAGSHTRVWQGRDSGGRQVPSGVYYVRMETPDRTDHRKIMLLK